jgi:hypothetical protein
MQLRGLDFANYAKNSLLAKRLGEKGYTREVAAEEADKDFGDGVIGHFECGHVYFRKGDDTCMLYQSRFSENWAIDRNGRRPPLVAFLADLAKMNNKEFVEQLIGELAV